MAGRNQRQDDGPEDPGQHGRRGRKPAVPPIIDLEATEVESGAGTAGTATRIEPDEEAGRGSAGDRTGGARQRPRFRSIFNPLAWGAAMKRFFSLRISHLRWSRIGAVVAVAVMLFAGGVWLGREIVRPVALPDGPADVGPDPLLAGIESAVRGLGERLDTIESSMQAVAEQMRQTEATAAQALQGLGAVQTTLATLADVPPAGEDRESLGRLQLQIGALATRFGALEAAVASLSENASGAAVEQRMEALTAALSDLETAMQAALADRSGDAIAGSGAAIDALAQDFRAGLADLEARLAARLDAFEREAPRVEPGTPALAVAVARLQQAVEGGGAFATELDAFAALAPHYDALADLRAHAQTGIETRAALTARFADMADAVRAGLDGAGAAGAQRQPGFFAGLWSRLTEMVDVRRQDAADPRTASARLDAASARLGAGDLDAAARELSGLDAAPARDWAEAVRARLEADRAMQEIVRRSLADVAAAGGRSGS
jgi:hypothetical protein